MKYFLALIAIIGVIACGASMVFRIVELDFTGAMAWLFGVFINLVMSIIWITEIREERL